MATKFGPGLRQLQLARALAELRRSAGVTAERAAQELRCSRGKVGHLESGRNVPSWPEVLALTTLYGATDRVDDILTMWEAASMKGWWTSYHLPRPVQTYLGLESDATSVRMWELELVPGLMQTEDYVRALFAFHDTPRAEVERTVEGRLQRQNNRPPGQKLVVLCSEALVHRTVNMGDVGVRQLQRIVDIVGKPDTELRVVPFVAGLHQCLAGSFTLLDFPDGTLKPVAYRHGASACSLTDTEDDVRHLELLFDLNLTQSLDTASSIKLVNNVLRTKS